MSMYAVGTAPRAVDSLPRLRRPRAAVRCATSAPPPPPYASGGGPSTAPRRAGPSGARGGVTAALRDFAARAALSPSESRQRHELIATVRRGVAELWGSELTPPPRVVPYGSFALDLSTPASDIDLTVLFASAGDGDGEKEKERAGAAMGAAAEDDAAVRSRMESDARNMRRLYQIADKLATMGFGVKVYEFCRVPVANVRDPFSNLSCDINVGLCSVEKVLSRQRKWLEQHDEARGLILVTKAVLKQWGLNSLFHGGLSSTALYTLVHRFIEERYCSGYNYLNCFATENFIGKFLTKTTTTTTVATAAAAAAAAAAAVPGERGLHAGLLLEFWRYASMDVSLKGCLFNVFATEDGKPPAGARDLTAGSYRLPEVLALFRHSAMLLDEAMADYSRAMFCTGGLSAILADPRQEQGGKARHVMPAANTNASADVLERHCVSPHLN